MIRTLFLAATLAAATPAMAHDRYYYPSPSVTVSVPSLSFTIGPRYSSVYVPGPVYVAPPPSPVYYYPAPSWRYDYRDYRHHRSHHHDRDRWRD